MIARRAGEPLNTLFIWLATLMFLTSSWDIFLTVKMGPTVRLPQLVLPILFGPALILALLGRCIQTIGLKPLLIWSGIQCLLVPVADFWQKSAAYCVWLGSEAALLFTFVQLFSRDFGTIRSLLSSYLYSFIALAIFGIAQFILPLLHGPPLLVQQWWIPGRIPRVNGFSYEPSYYATYLIIGFVLMGSLKDSADAAVNRRLVSVGQILTGVALILCSSRIGVLFVFLDLTSRTIARHWVYIYYPFRCLKRRVSALVMFASLLAGPAAIVALLLIGFGLRSNLETVKIVLAGTGLLGTPAHSVATRNQDFVNTVEVFLDHPIVGRGLGGITEAIALKSGFLPHSFEEAKPYEGMSVFMEALAASGIVGILPFIVFVVVTVWKPFELSRRVQPFYRDWLNALVRSLLFEWSILQFNQNILRLYLWVHIAVLAATYAAAKRAKGLEDQLEIAM